MESSSAFDYGVVEGEQLYVASEKPVTFSYDSVNEVVKQTTVPEDSSIEELQTEEAIDKEDGKGLIEAFKISTCLRLETSHKAIPTSFVQLDTKGP